MRTIIAGPRTIMDYRLVEEAVEASGYHITEVISGGAGGVDSLGEEYALAHNIPLHREEVYDFEWDESIEAGFKRNGRVVARADALIAVWDEKSRGTRDCIVQAKAKGIPVYVHRVPPT